MLFIPGAKAEVGLVLLPLVLVCSAMVLLALLFSIQGRPTIGRFDARRMATRALTAPLPLGVGLAL